MSQYEEYLDDFIMETWGIEEEDAKTFREAVMNLAYEDLFKPLWKHQDKLKSTIRAAFSIVVVLQLILIGLQLRSLLW